MSHNPYATQPPAYTPTRINPLRGCGCTQLIHEHGCRYRYYPQGCHCFTCRLAHAELQASKRAKNPRRTNRRRPPTTPPRRKNYVNPKRTCTCPQPVHEHGCYNRHRIDGCDGTACGGACPRARSRYESARRKRYRKYPPTPQTDPTDDVDWVVVERLIAGMSVKANTAEVVTAVKRLRARGMSYRTIEEHFADLVNQRAAATWIRNMYVRSRARARLEVAA